MKRARKTAESNINFHLIVITHTSASYAHIKNGNEKQQQQNGYVKKNRTAEYEMRNKFMALCK